MCTACNACFSMIDRDPCSIGRLQGANFEERLLYSYSEKHCGSSGKLQGWVAESKAWGTDIYLLGVLYVNKRVESMCCKQKGQRLGKQTQHNQRYVARVNKCHVKTLLCEYEVSFWFLHRHIHGDLNRYILVRISLKNSHDQSVQMPDSPFHE